MFSQDLAPREGRGGIKSLAHISVVLRRDSHLCSPGVRSCLAAVSCPLVRVPPQGPGMIALPPLVGAGQGPWARRTSPGPDRGVSSFGTQTHGFAPAMDNDPSAGSPTETLLRLLLPLNDQIRTSFICTPGDWQRELPARGTSKALTKPFIGSSDGRCVQRAGT